MKLTDLLNEWKDMPVETTGVDTLHKINEEIKDLLDDMQDAYDDLIEAGYIDGNLVAAKEEVVESRQSAQFSVHTNLRMMKSYANYMTGAIDKMASKNKG